MKKYLIALLFGCICMCLTVGGCKRKAEEQQPPAATEPTPPATQPAPPPAQEPTAPEEAPAPEAQQPPAQ